MACSLSDSKDWDLKVSFREAVMLLLDCHQIAFHVTAALDCLILSR